MTVQSGYRFVHQFESRLTTLLTNAQLDVTPDLTRDEAGVVVEGMLKDLSLDDAMTILAEAATTGTLANVA